MTDNNATEIPMPDGPVRDNAAWRRYLEHQERMAKALAPKDPHYAIEQKSPPGKSGGFEFTVSGPDPDAVEAKALEWADKFPAPQPVQK